MFPTFEFLHFKKFYYGKILNIYKTREYNNLPPCTYNLALTIVSIVHPMVLKQVPCHSYQSIVSIVLKFSLKH